ncbi:hypothetical protein LPJ74_006477, partial [Coemansia sp. RSA 1843]
MADNRLRVGATVVGLLFVQTMVLVARCCSISSTDRNNRLHYLSSYAQSTALILFLSVVCLVNFVRSTRLSYIGLFPWVLPAHVGAQLVMGLCEMYFALAPSQPNAGSSVISAASTDRAFAVSATTASLVLLLLFSIVQKGPIFRRSSDGAAFSVFGLFITYTQMHNTDEEEEQDSETTPLADPKMLNESKLVHTPESNSSWFDKLTFSWANNLFRQGASRQLGYSDLYRLDDKSMPVHNWKRYQSHYKPGRSLQVTLLRTFAPEFIAQGVLSASLVVLEFTGPFFFQRIIRNQTLWIGRIIGIRMKSVLVANLSSKTLNSSGNGSLDDKNDGKDKKITKENKKSGSNKTSSNSGKVINILTTDFERITELASHIDDIYRTPLSLCIGIWYIYKLLGISAIIGLSFAIVYFPITNMLYSRMTNMWEKLSSLNDKRVTIVTDALQGIKAIKLFGWESRFVKKVDESRERQLEYSWNILLWQILLGSVSSLSPSLILVVILSVYVGVYGNNLTAELAFTSMAIFNMIHSSFKYLPRVFSWVTSTLVSFKRVDTYLCQPQAQDLEKRISFNHENALGFDNANLEWASSSPEDDATRKDISTATPNIGSTSTGASTDSRCVKANDQILETTPLLSDHPSSQAASSISSQLVSTGDQDKKVAFSLKNIDVQFPLGGLSIIAGPTGSGKTSLLCALIGDMNLTAGRILLPTADPRIDVGMGRSYKDIIDLSGETLAIRDIAYVAQEAWLRNATIRENILFGESYNRERYEEVLRVCALKPDLRILCAGDMTEIGERGVTLSGGQKQRISLARAVYSSRRILLIDDCLSAVDMPTARHILTECLLSKTALMLGRTQVLVTHHVSMCLPHAQFAMVMHDGQIKMKSTSTETHVWRELHKVLGKLNDRANDASSSDSENSKDTDLANDIKSEDEYNKERQEKIAIQTNNDPTANHTTLQAIANIQPSSVVSSVWSKSISGGVNFEVHASPRFFDSTPAGRITSRFSRDIGTIDDKVLDRLVLWFTEITSLLAIIFIISSIIPLFIVVAIILMLLYASIAIYYLNTSRELQRLESNSMSPLLSLIGEISQGVPTIRAFSSKKLYIKEALSRLNLHSRSFYVLWMANRWLALRIDIASAAVSSICALLIISNLDWIDASLAAFVLSYALSFSSGMLWAIRNYSANELNMNSVERIVQYLKTDQEADLNSTEENKPPITWPRQGNVQVKDLTAGYVPGVPILHGVSFSVEHGEKIGVVGRTGAGKSTLSLAFLRFVEACKGQIVLDGVDISKIGLEDLRRNITIIPQDPVLFNGTIRFNLDPFDEFPDEIIWDALKRTHLVCKRDSDQSSEFSTDSESTNILTTRMLVPGNNTSGGVFTSLNDVIKENGQTLSLGQRQLVAISRALVRRSKLIVMDEATASIDFETDDKIQRTIRGYEFANSTVFCIAHRVRTIIDYDRVLVLDKGKVAEFDTPQNLLQNENGIFRTMCLKSGEYDHLLELSS